MGGARTVLRRSLSQIHKRGYRLSDPIQSTQKKSEIAATVGLENAGLALHCGRKRNILKKELFIDNGVTIIILFEFSSNTNPNITAT